MGQNLHGLEVARALIKNTVNLVPNSEFNVHLFKRTSLTDFDKTQCSSVEADLFTSSSI